MGNVMQKSQFLAGLESMGTSYYYNKKSNRWIVRAVGCYLMAIPLGTDKVAIIKQNIGRNI